MNSTVLTALLPVVATIAVGIALGRTGWLSPRLLKFLSDVVFNVLTPILLFRSMSTVDIARLDLRPAGVYALSLLLVYAAVMAAQGWRRASGVLALAATYSNGVMIGIPLVALAWGDLGLVTLFTLVPVHSLVLLTGATVVQEFLLAKEDAAPASGVLGRALRVGGRSLRRAVIHPVPLPIIAGLLWAQTGWGIAAPVQVGMRWLGSAFGPLALILVGVSLARVSIGAQWRPALVLTVLKNAVVPLVTMGVARLLGLQGIPLLVTVLLAALPAGANAFIFSQRYGDRQAMDLVAATVAMTTAVAVFSVTVVMWWLGAA